MEAVRLVEFNLKQVLTKLMTHIFGDGRFLHLFSWSADGCKHLDFREPFCCIIKTGGLGVMVTACILKQPCGFFLMRVVVILGVFIHILYYYIFVLNLVRVPSQCLLMSELLATVWPFSCNQYFICYCSLILLYPHLIKLLSTAQQATHSSLGFPEYWCTQHCVESSGSCEEVLVHRVT